MILPKESFFGSDGVELHYIDWGGVGRPVVLLAGLGDTAHIYRGLAPRLASQFRVVGLTRRGHGRSDRPDSGYDLDTLVQDVAHFLDALGIERTTLIGHSFAGIEMPRFAVRYPQRVDGIVYLDAIFPKLDPEPDLSGDPVWSAPVPGPIAEDLTSREAYLAYYRRTRPDLSSIWCEAIEANRLADVSIRHDGRVEDHHDDALMHRIAATFESRNPEYGEVRAPALAIVPDGDYHPGVPPDVTDEVRRAADRYWRDKLRPWIRQRTEVFRLSVPSARVIELDSPNHRIFVAKEDETVRAIKGFLRG